MDHKSFGSVLILIIIICFSSCKVHSPDFSYEVMSDTVYVTRLVDRCNYQYLSADLKMAKKQLKEAIRQLDQLIIKYDQELTTKGKIASQKYKKLKSYE